MSARFTEVPTALWECGEALGLSMQECVVAQQLWSFKWYADSGIRPSQEHLARRCRMSTDSVARHVKGLERRGLLKVKRATESRYSRIVSYDLTPMWAALAEHLRESTSDSAVESKPDLHVIEGGRPNAPQSSDLPPHDAEVRVGNLRTEVDEPEADDQSKSRARASDPDEELANALRREAASPKVKPWERLKMLKEADQAAKRARSARDLEAIERLRRRDQSNVIDGRAVEIPE